jgi:hypothetical protein
VSGPAGDSVATLVGLPEQAASEAKQAMDTSDARSIGMKERLMGQKVSGGRVIYQASLPEIIGEYAELRYVSTAHA